MNETVCVILPCIICKYKCIYERPQYLNNVIELNQSESKVLLLAHRSDHSECFQECTVYSH